MERRWQRSDFEVREDPAAELALRFAAYHAFALAPSRVQNRYISSARAASGQGNVLTSAVNPADEHVSIGARGLTGDDYHGHVFWDTEIYLLPFYTLTWPEAARALLMYRFWTLEGARAKAAGMGWRGAMYPWESADTGAEATPERVVCPDGHIVEVLCGNQEQHITADVAYAVWQYWQATRDEEFLLRAGAEILLETGRFWSSRAQAEADGYCHIRGVIGPDEYHEHIDDNAYECDGTLEHSAGDRCGWPAARTLARALGKPLNQLALGDTEIVQWQTVAETMATGLNRETGLFEQFAGFFDLEEIDLTAYEGRSVPMDVVLGRERIQKAKVIKQADVVALLGLLPEEFTSEHADANFRYYEPLCGHGSSLSSGMHGLVAARLGYSDLALRYFQHAAAIDLADTHTTIAGGLHMASLGGTWLTAVFGFAGLSLQGDEIALNPKLPAKWRSLGFAVEWRGRRLKFRIDADHDLLQAKLESGDSMTLLVNGRQHEVRCERPTVCPL